MYNAIGNFSQPYVGALSRILAPLKPALQPVSLPTGTSQARSPTNDSQLQTIVQNLSAKAEDWANLDCIERATLLRKCIDTSVQATEDAAALMVKAKGSYGNGLGEERSLLITPCVGLREYAETLEAGGQPPPQKLYQRSDGRHVAQNGSDLLWWLEGTLAHQKLDEVMLSEFNIYFAPHQNAIRSRNLTCSVKGELWIPKGAEPSQGRVYRELAAGIRQKGAVGLVLGAGNQISVLMLDILDMLVHKNCVVVCKFNPVLDYLGSYAEQALQPLIEAGYLAFAYGGSQQGKFLCHHPLIDRVHLTGSEKTYDAIVWNGKPKSGEQELKKPVTAELGCVTPYLITPGAWSEQAIEYYADECVAGLINNAAHNCTKLELLITAKDWPQREDFIAAVRSRLANIPRRVAWYPGSDKKFHDFKAKFNDAEELGVKVDSHRQLNSYHPWLFKTNLSPEEADTGTENWCGVLQEVALPLAGSDPTAFLEKAVKFANDRCWGSLSCTVIAPPETDAAALDTAVADLRYGAVCVNLPSFAAFTFPKLSWGAYPGNTPQDIGSGIGTVHNAQLYDNVEKCVMYSTWIQHPTHLWSTKVRNLDATTYHAQRFLAHPSLFALTRTALSALRG